MKTTMTTADINKRINELNNILNTCLPSDSRWDEAYKEYFELSEILNERYRQENESEFQAFYNKHIKGRKWEDIDPKQWDFYSDWHKDMYGYRPRAI